MTSLIGPLLISSPFTIAVQPYVISSSDLVSFLNTNTTLQPCWVIFLITSSRDCNEFGSTLFLEIVPSLKTVMYLFLIFSLLSVLPQNISSKFVQSCLTPNLNFQWKVTSEPKFPNTVLGGTVVKFVPGCSEKKKKKEKIE